MSNIKDQPDPSSAMVERIQEPHPRRLRDLKHWRFLIVALFFTAGGTILWILSILGVINGSWSSIFGALFTALGVLLALLQLFPWLSRETVTNTASPSVSIQNQQNHYVHLDGVMLGVDEHKGALVVYAKRYLRGSTINLSCGFSHVDLRAETASNVVGRRKDGRIVYVAIFPALEPGNYTVYSESREFIAKVSIHAGQTIEVDWQ